MDENKFKNWADYDEKVKPKILFKYNIHGY